jgi:hypothetical protein
MIESDPRRNHSSGQDFVRHLPERFAVTEIELASELRSAAAMLVGAWSDSEEMFVDEGYGAKCPRSPGCGAVRPAESGCRN